MTVKRRLLRIFDILLSSFGKRNWWPGESQLEIAVGAILTQNTSWSNVEKAILNMKKEGLLDVKKIYETDVSHLGRTIKSAGFFNVKSRRLKNFIKVLYEEYSGNFDSLGRIELDTLRKLLLSINGIGYETADSIILYALYKPVFVVDAYTKRFLKNHNLYGGSFDYGCVQKFFMENLPHDTYIFNEFHALIVCLCQQYCTKLPKCDGCPLKHDMK